MYICIDIGLANIYEILEKSKWTFWSTQYLTYMNIWKPHIYIYYTNNSIISPDPNMYPNGRYLHIYQFCSSGEAWLIHTPKPGHHDTHLHKVQDETRFSLSDLFMDMYVACRTGFWSQRLQT